MSKRLAILMVHQGWELYGSDRSFTSSVEAVRDRYPDAQLDVVLPAYGPLADVISPMVSTCTFMADGFLRKVDLTTRPFYAIKGMLAGVAWYARLLRQYDICYVNTVVCVSAIVALRSFDGASYVHVREIPGKRALPVFKALVRFSRASVIYNSHASACAFGSEGTVIHNGVDSSVTLVNPSPRSNVLKVAIVGRINTWKGQQFVLDSLLTAGRDLPVHVRVVGDVFPGYEGLLEKLQDTAKRCAQEIEFSGFVGDTSSSYEWADFVLVPSIKPEPFGRVAIESFSYGKPVIAANAGGLTEIVKDSVNGFLFESASSTSLLESLRRAAALSDRQYLAMSRAALSTHENSFTVKQYIEKLALTVQARQKAS